MCQSQEVEEEADFPIILACSLFVRSLHVEGDILPYILGSSLAHQLSGG